MGRVLGITDAVSQRSTKLVGLWDRQPITVVKTLTFYRLEDIFQRQGFEISRATQSIWCGDVADLVEPLYELMARRVRESHVVATDDTIMPMQSVGKAAQVRMWVYVGDADHPYNLFHFTLDRRP